MVGSPSREQHPNRACMQAAAPFRELFAARSHEPENEMAPPQIHRNGGRDERASANLTRETNGAGRTGSRRAGLPRLCRRGWAGRSDDEHAEQERLRLGEGFLLPVVVDEGCLFIDRTEDTLKGYAAVLFWDGRSDEIPRLTRFLSLLEKQKKKKVLDHPCDSAKMFFHCW